MKLWIFLDLSGSLCVQKVELGTNVNTKLLGISAYYCLLILLSLFLTGFTGELVCVSLNDKIYNKAYVL